MANPLRGEVDLAFGDKTYTLRLSVNALCEAEALLGQTVNEIIASLDRVTTLRALMWAGLVEHHPNVTIIEAGDLIGLMGADMAGSKIGEALQAAFPQPDTNARPQKAARAGTGKVS